MGQIPLSTGPQIAPSVAPSARVGALGPGAFGAGLAQGLGKLGAGMQAAHEKEKRLKNASQVLSAHGQAMSSMNRIMAELERESGQNYLDAVDGAREKWQREVDALRAGMDPETALVFDAKIQAAGLRFDQRIADGTEQAGIQVIDMQQREAIQGPLEAAMEAAQSGDVQGATGGFWIPPGGTNVIYMPGARDELIGYKIPGTDTFVPGVAQGYAEHEARKRGISVEDAEIQVKEELLASLHSSVITHLLTADPKNPRAEEAQAYYDFYVERDEIPVAMRPKLAHDIAANGSAADVAQQAFDTVNDYYDANPDADIAQARRDLLTDVDDKKLHKAIGAELDDRVQEVAKRRTADTYSAQTDIIETLPYDLTEDQYIAQALVKYPDLEDHTVRKTFRHMKSGEYVQPSDPARIRSVNMILKTLDGPVSTSRTNDLRLLVNGGLASLASSGELMAEDVKLYTATIKEELGEEASAEGLSSDVIRAIENRVKLYKDEAKRNTARDFLQSRALKQQADEGRPISEAEASGLASTLLMTYTDEDWIDTIETMYQEYDPTDRKRYLDAFEAFNSVRVYNESLASMANRGIPGPLPQPIELTEEAVEILIAIGSAQLSQMSPEEVRAELDRGKRAKVAWDLIFTAGSPTGVNLGTL